MRRRAVRRHDALSAAWDELAERHTPARPLAEFLARHESDPEGYALAQAKEDLLLQPLVQEVAQRAVAGDPHFGMSFLTDDPVAYFAREHEALRQGVLRTAVPGYALLTLDGSWWDADGEGYGDRANAYLDDLDPEAVVVDVLCHC
ncbi:hypothetical protein [Streptomyces griseochromogenes]|uniref:hypothetical protein n=1 Tax=Streptomyces griseochromogenes TaxID=68214 RepID=UPI00378F0614